MEHTVDFLIIGAGPSGLCSARTILKCDPDANVRIVDAHSTVGGVWAKDQIYPGLRTNNWRGTLDFTDFPMHEGYGIPQRTHVTGDAMNRYLRDYAEHFGLMKCIDFNVKVQDVSQRDGGQGWRIRTEVKAETVIYNTRKLIVATGITQRPHIPPIEGSSAFKRPILHSEDLGRRYHSLTKDESINTVAVVGGGKSAMDAAYLAASSGHEVEWMIRKSGRGPAWTFPVITKLGPFSARREKLSTIRMANLFSSSIWSGGFNWLRYFLHKTGLGRKITQGFWLNMHKKTIAESGYRTHDNLKVLEPETSPFWFGTQSGAYSYPKDNSLFDYVKSGKIRVYREDIISLSPSTIHLTNNHSLPIDALILATGFSPQPAITFSPSTLHSDLGLPTTSLTPTQTTFWASLDRKADCIIGTHYPRLLQGPHTSPSSSTIQPFHSVPDPELSYTPFRLYRAIAPPGLTTSGNRSLVFVGMVGSIAATIRLELQCLWSYAYLTSQLDIDTGANDDTTAKDDTGANSYNGSPGTRVFEEAALLSRFAHWRSSYGHGRWYLDIVFDQNMYLDMLVADLGCRVWRKCAGWWDVWGWCRELVESYGQDDYRGIVAEWLERRRMVVEEGKEEEWGRGVGKGSEEGKEMELEKDKGRGWWKLMVDGVGQSRRIVLG